MTVAAELGPARTSASVRDSVEEDLCRIGHATEFLRVIAQGLPDADLDPVGLIGVRRKLVWLLDLVDNYCEEIEITLSRLDGSA